MGNSKLQKEKRKKKVTDMYYLHLLDFVGTPTLGYESEPFHGDFFLHGFYSCWMTLLLLLFWGKDFPLFFFWIITFASFWEYWRLLLDFSLDIWPKKKSHESITVHRLE